MGQPLYQDELIEKDFRNSLKPLGRLPVVKSGSGQKALFQMDRADTRKWSRTEVTSFIAAARQLLLARCFEKAFELHDRLEIFRSSGSSFRRNQPAQIERQHASLEGFDQPRRRPDFVKGAKTGDLREEINGSRCGRKRENGRIVESSGIPNKWQARRQIA